MVVAISSDRSGPMKTIRISDATYHAIAETAIYPFHSTARRLPDGDWLVELADDTYERLRSHRLPGETDDDAILRALHVHSGRPNN